MEAILLYKAGEITPHGDPVICHFGPGCSIAPHERAAETKTVIVMHGQKFTVRGHWKEIAARAGYDDLIKEFEKAEKKWKKGDDKKKPESKESKESSKSGESSGSPFDTEEPPRLESIGI